MQSAYESEKTPMVEKHLQPLIKLALARQGLANRDSFPAGEEAVPQALNRLGFLQIDTISVVARAHQHTLWNRIRDYEPQMLDAAIAERSVFEYWAHAAAYLPMRDYRFAQIRMRNMRDGKARWIRSTDKALMRRVLKRIQTEGPLRSRDFKAPARATRGWWDWKPTKRALEQLFMQGDLMIEGREGFQKRYDLRERILPGDIDTRMPTDQEYAEYLVQTQLRSFGASPEPSFSYLLTGRELRTSVNEILLERERSGELEVFEVGGVRWFVDVNHLGELSPETTKGTVQETSAPVFLLSPFDNLIIQRDRLRALFGFDYILECYVPEGKRKYGYFSLPILQGNQFIGRIDCKAHRKTRVFEVKQLFWEPDVDAQKATAPLACELVSFARFNGCRKVEFGPRIKRGKQKKAAAGLADALDQLQAQS